MVQEKRISYLEVDQKFLIVTEMGESFIFKTRAEFSTYVTKNNCIIIN